MTRSNPTRPRSSPVTASSGRVVVPLLLLLLSSTFVGFAGAKLAFEPSEAAVEFSEGAVVGTRRLLAQAVGDEEVAGYSLVAGNEDGHFRLQETRAGDDRDEDRDDGSSLSGGVGSSGSGKILYLHLETVRKLDREAKDGYRLNVSVQGRAGGPPSFLDLAVSVLDINDNPPAFDREQYEAEIDDTVEAGSEVVRVSASDPDAGKNGRLTYHMVSAPPDPIASVFALDPETGILRALDHRPLRCGRRARRTDDGGIAAAENCLPCLSGSGQCSIAVVAKDDGQPQQSAQAVIRIRLVETNTRPPKISFRYLAANDLAPEAAGDKGEGGPSFASVDEGAAPGSSVAAVIVTDPDAGEFGETTVKLVSGNEQRHFVLESYGGGSLNVIKISKEADFVRGRVYNLTLSAADGGSPPLQSAASILIKVRDVNEHPPKFQQSDYEATVPEDAPSGTSVVVLKATDEDEETKGSSSFAGLEYRIASGNERGWFEINKHSGLVVVAEAPPAATVAAAASRGVLDRESEEVVNLVVVVQDSGTQPKTSSAQLRIAISNVNDEAPQFDQQAYFVTVPEHFEKLRPFLTVKATDADLVDDLAYSIERASLRYGRDAPEDGDEDLLGINKQTGEIFLLQELDREAPLRRRPAPPESGSTGSGRPPLTRISFDVAVTDGKHISVAKVQVAVSDINDNPPTVYPVKYYIPLPVSSWDPGGGPPSAKVRIRATDPDNGANSTLTFSLVDNDNSSPAHSTPVPGLKVALESDTGILTATLEDTSALKTSSPAAAVTVKVRATDGGGLTSVDAAEVTIFEALEDPQERLFEKNIYTFDLDENDVGNLQDLQGHPEAAAQREVGTISLTNPSTLPLTFEVIDGDEGNQFTAVGIPRDSSTLKVFAQGTIDREQKAVYNLTLVALIDNGSALPSAKFHHCHVVINVKDLNDCAPRFPADEKFRLKVVADAALNSIVHKVRAVDNDLGGSPNSSLTYELLPGDFAYHFAVDRDTGILRVRAPLTTGSRTSPLLGFGPDRTAAASEMTVAVKVTDGGGLSGTETYLIEVVPVNTYTPTFDFEHNEISVKENTPLNSEVISLKALDMDGDTVFGKVSYRIVAGDVDKFGVFPDGRVYLRGPLDREVQAYHSLVVMAQDGGPEATRRSSSATVVVYVEDENDNAPLLFDSSSHPYGRSTAVFYLYENEDAGTVVGRIEAIDADVGRNAELSYHLVTDTDFFRMDAKTGLITSTVTIDRESLVDSTGGQDSFQLDLTVLDGAVASARRSASATVSVVILDRNDNAPKFERPVYQATVVEGIKPAGFEVIRVQANDVDKGRNGAVTYRLNSTVPRGGPFRINGSSGLITLVNDGDEDGMVVLDREAVSEYTLTVVVTDNGGGGGGGPGYEDPLTSACSVKVMLSDVNDEPPTFKDPLLSQGGQVQLELSEGTPIGTKLYQFEAVDPDMGANGKIEYHLLRSSGSSASSSPSTSAAPIQRGLLHHGVGGGDLHDHFHLDKVTGILTLVGQLDRELRGRFEMLVAAVDGGSPPLSSSILVQVEVSDVNDNAPSFPAGVNSVPLRLLEGVAVGSRVHKFEATDPDAGLNGSVVYSIEAWEDEEDIDFFRIDVKSGTLFTAKEIDREAKESFSLTVVAEDEAADPFRLRSQRRVDIVVDDVNDNSPSIVSLDTALVVQGVTALGSTILRVRAEDRDSFFTNNGAVTYEAAGGDLGRELALDRNSGHLKFVKPFEWSDPDSDDKIPSSSPSSSASMISRKVRVVARDEAVPSERRSATAVVNVLVVDGRRNSASNLFSSAVYETEVVENSPVGTPVQTIELLNKAVKDLSTTASAEFHLVGCQSQKGEDRGGLFLIDRKTGQIRVAGKVDREVEGNLVTLKVVALVDGGATWSVCTVNVTIKDENDTPPKFPQDMRIELSEDFAPGREVARIEAVDEDLDNAVSYSLGGPEAQTFLRIDAQSGVLSLTQTIDRELYRSVMVTIQASDGVHVSEWRRRVAVKNVNDNAPIFQKAQFSFDVMETAQQGDFVGRVEAHDADDDDGNEDDSSRGVEPSSGKSGGITYSFIPDWGADLFALNPTTGVITLSSVGGLDFEEIEHFILTVSASDSGEPTLTATATVFINVINVNDNDPKIELAVYQAVVREDSQIGTSVVRIEASDADMADEGGGRSSGLTFLIVDSASSGASEVFDLLEDGTIVTKQALDRETAALYVFKVKVVDDPDPRYQRTATCLVEVTVSDVNDQSPAFEPIPFAHVLENSPPNTPILTVRAIDRDDGDNGVVVYVLDDTYEDKFSIGRLDGILRSAKSLDREEMDSYHLSVIALDQGTPSLSSRVQFTVDVLDVNDNSPEFRQRHYSVSVMENASIGMDVLHAIAVDKDSSSSGKLRYNIVSGDNRGDFSMDETTGLIRVAKLLDYEKQNVYELTIQAGDDDDPVFFLVGGGQVGRPRASKEPHYDTATVTILILDANDNAPKFQHSPYHIRILENDFSPNVPVFTLEAVDIDDPPYNEVEYSIRAGGKFDDYFKVNRKNGQVLITGPLDRERESMLTVEILAVDSGSPRLTSTGTLTVLVEDVNDNVPTFENDFYEFRVREDANLGTEVGQVLAIDRDSPANANVTYSFLADDSTFRIEPKTGVIYTSIQLDREHLSWYIFEVMAQDSSEFQPLKSRTKVSIIVTDANDNPPEILDTGTEGTGGGRRRTTASDDYFIPPGLKDGSFVLGVAAVDRDEGDNSLLRFQILPTKDAAMFSMNKDNGVVTTSKTFADKPSYAIDVRVSDSGQPALSSQRRLNIYLAKELVVPIFEAEETTGQVEEEKTVDEDLPKGSSVAVVKANGGVHDGQEGHRVNYGIAGGNTDMTFDVDKVSGMVTVNTSLDYERNKVFELWIKAFFETKPLFSAAKMIRVFVRDVNDNPPVFDSPLTRLSILEGGYPPFDLMELYAFDADSGANAEISYRIVSVREGLEKVERVDDRLFAVDEFTGLISCQGILDRERNDRFVLELEARDRPETDGRGGSIHGGSLSSTATVLLTVQDINDNAPRFTRLYSLNVTENTALGTNLLRVETFDSDSLPENSNVSYSLVVNPDDTFAVHPSRGDVTLAKGLDREVREEYLLKVQASDGVWRLETAITVLIEDVNDNAPKFDLNTYGFTVPYHHLSDTAANGSSGSSRLGIDGVADEAKDDNDDVVGRVQALDRDSLGPNSAVSYSLASSSDFFSVDEATGQISTKKDNLKYYTTTVGTTDLLGQVPEGDNNRYRIRVVATDSGSPPMSSECEVVIHLVSGNRLGAPRIIGKVPVDEEDQVAVPFNVESGTVVYTIRASTDDPAGQPLGTAGLEYFADENPYFSVDRKSGEVRVAANGLEAADGDRIVPLTVRVVAEDDGIRPRMEGHRMVVNLTVTGENLNAPEFQTPVTRIHIREDEPVGSRIVTLTASDKDQGLNGAVRYRIVRGNQRGAFRMDAETGHIFVNAPLDYDVEDRADRVYDLVVEAKDRGFSPRSSTSVVKVVLQDVDDNPPKFVKKVLFGKLKENSDPRTVVEANVKATDADSPKHAGIRYEILRTEDPNTQSEPEFAIDPQTGVVTSLVTFDYEQVQKVELKVKATSIISIGSPSSPLGSNVDTYDVATLVVEIEGVNEFYPRFKQPIFHFAVSEAAKGGTVVGRVEALDGDSGPDGVIYFFFVGSSNAAGFNIDRLTGEIRVRESLDRESQNRYVLTVLAKNKGSILGNDTDEAQVIIQVQDGNDPPQFDQTLYEASVGEAAPLDTLVATVRAVDRDVRPPRNSQFNYVIHSGNVGEAFVVGASSGEIRTAKPLDRETVALYNLTVRAVDHGLPPAVGETLVLIVVEDVNDSPPKIVNTLGSVKENSPANSFVMQLKATDPDDWNGAGQRDDVSAGGSADDNRFRFYLLPGQHAEMLELEADTGVLRTTRPIDREEFPFLNLTVEVHDGGDPPLHARQEVKVEVLDENDNPSQPRSMDVVIKNYEGIFPGGTVLTARPRDPDLKGDYQCQLVEGPENIFSLKTPPRGCRVSAGRIQNGREYELKIQANDGVHPDVQVRVSLNFVGFSKFAVRESVLIRFLVRRGSPVKAASSVLNYFKNLRPSEGDNRVLELLSLMTSANATAMDNVEVVECFVASRDNEVFLTKASTLVHLKDLDIQAALPTAEATVVVDFDPCTGSSDGSPCKNGGICSTETRVMTDLEPEITESDDTVFNSPRLVKEVACKCGEEFAGDTCQVQKNPCMPNPCQDGGQCLAQGLTFKCLCKPRKTGRRCEETRSDGCLPSNPCQNGGTCQHSESQRDSQSASNNGAFFCLCRPGYQGELCETVIDNCRENPCLNGGTCVSLKPNYKCRCHDHYYGNHCEFSTFGFDGLSFATFPALDPTTNDVSVTFATSKPNALLVYNFGRAAGGRSDFFALELVEGKPKMSWGGSRTTITSLKLDRRRLDTGRWYKVTATRNNRVGSLSVEDCTESGEYCKTCRTEDESCFTKGIGPAGTLIFSKNPVYFGGVDDESVIFDRPGQVSTIDFVGCIKGISINGNEKDVLKESLNHTNIQDTCNHQPKGGPCSSGDSVCGNDGVCLPFWSHNKCMCGPNKIVAYDCGSSFQPLTLVEGQEIHFRPTRKFIRDVRLKAHRQKSPSVTLRDRWKRSTASSSRSSSSVNDGTFSPTVSLSFRTLKYTGTILKVVNGGRAATSSFTVLELNEGVLEYRSRNGAGKPVVNMTTNVGVADGSWHSFRLEVINDRVLRLFLDGQRVGYDVEFVVVHDPFSENVEKFVIGDASQTETGFRGCLSNFTLSDELQSVRASSRSVAAAAKGSSSSSSSSFLDQYLEADIPAGVSLEGGCDVEALTVVTQSRNAVNVGVTVVVIFFILLLCALAGSFTYYRFRRKSKEEALARSAGAASMGDNLNNKEGGPKGPAGSLNNAAGLENKGFETSLLSQSSFQRHPHHPPSEPHHYMFNTSGRNPMMMMVPLSSSIMANSNPQDCQKKPDIIEADGRGLVQQQPLPAASPTLYADPMYNHQDPEHYDIDNASSIAPSDIDIVYHYKGYRDHHHHHRNHKLGQRSLPKKKKSGGHNHHLQQTPLARLSPSSEMSRNTPRILTLNDLSGKPLPSSLLMEQHSERSLHSPISHVSSSNFGGVRAVQGNNARGLTSENVARFNAKQRSTPPTSPANVVAAANNSSTLVNTLDLVSIDSESRKKGSQAMVDEDGYTGLPEVRRGVFPDDVDGSSNGSSNGSSSSSENGDNDSFTCSEYEYDSNNPGGQAQGRGQGRQQSLLARSGADRSGTPGTAVDHRLDTSNGMVFSKLIPPRGERVASNFSEADDNSSDEEFEGPCDPDSLITSMSLGRQRPDSTSGKTWENLLTWWPDYETFSGVFKDIAELPNEPNELDFDEGLGVDGVCRPNPVGDRGADEEYI